MGNYAEAEQCYEEALAGGEGVLDESHLKIAGVLNNLAALCRKTGQSERANNLLARASSALNRCLSEFQLRAFNSGEVILLADGMILLPGP